MAVQPCRAMEHAKPQPAEEAPAKEVTAAVIERDGRILLLRRAPGQKCEGLWEFPGGKTEAGETPEACLERELREELSISGHTREHIIDSPYSYPGGRINLRAYRFDWTAGELRLSVHDALAWCQPAELTSYALSPADIPIAQHLAATLTPPSREQAPQP